METSQKFNLLCAEDLVKKSTNSITTSLTPIAKKNFPDGSDEEVTKLKELHSNLREILSLERVGTISTRTVGDYDNATGQVRLRNISGTLQTFGHTNELNETYLDSHEALYLMEMNRLIVFQNTVVMSLERAFEIFLSSTLSLEEYTVYAFLNKLGYIVRRFNPNTPYIHERRTDIECPESSSGSKRKNISNEDGTFKKLRRDHQSYTGKSTIEQVICEAPMELRNSFASFSVVQLTPGKRLTQEEGKMRNLTFNYDLYNPRKIFKKSQPDPPDYRVILRSFDQTCLSRDELLVLHDSHEIKCPIIAIYIDDHLKMSGFLYYFA